MQPENQIKSPNSSDSPNETVSPPPQRSSGSRTLHPINDMSEYTTQPSVPSTQPVQESQTEKKETETAQPTATSIYPDLNKTVAPQTSPLTNGSTVNTAIDNTNQRVASKVSSLQIYSFLLIILSLYILFAYLSLGNVLKVLSPVSQVLILGPVLINIAIGIYLLISKNITTVSALLTVLLVLNGLGVLNRIVNFFRYSSTFTPNANSVISLLVSIGMLFYLWGVKSQVDILKK